MINLHTPYFSEEFLTHELCEFFNETFKLFGEEMQRLSDTIYSYKDSTRDLFALNERAWLGVLNNAILRAYEEVTSLQEFSVYDSRGFVGRADLLVSWKNKKGKSFHILFEAKQYEETNKKYMLEDTKNYFLSLKNQALRYYNAEISYYSETTFIVPIAFGWIREQDLLNVANEYLYSKAKNDKTTDFCSLYSKENHGVWIYGKVYSAKE